MLNKPVSEIMATGDALPVVHENDFFRKALEEMSRKGLGGVAVVDSSDRLVGIIADGDIKRIIQHTNDPLPKLFMNYVRDEMRREPKHVSPDTTVRDTLTLMHEKSIWCMPVVGEDQKLIGFFQMHTVLEELLNE